MAKKKRKNRKKPSPKQVAANQANAQLSTGAKSPEGKARCRQNAITHGAFVPNGVLLPWEDPHEFARVYGEAWVEIDPRTALERHYADAYIWYTWKLDRVRRYEGRLEKDINNGWLLQQERDKAHRTEERISRLQDRARKNFNLAREGKLFLPPREPAPQQPNLPEPCPMETPEAVESPTIETVVILPAQEDAAKPEDTVPPPEPTENNPPAEPPKPLPQGNPQPSDDAPMGSFCQPPVARTTPPPGEPGSGTF